MKWFPKKSNFGNTPEPVQPFHEHICTDDDGEEHKWTCASPYCDSVSSSCPEHGGEVKIAAA